MALMMVVEGRPVAWFDIQELIANFFPASHAINVKHCIPFQCHVNQLTRIHPTYIRKMNDCMAPYELFFL